MHPDEQFQDLDDAYNDEHYGKPPPIPPHKLKTIVEVGELQHLRASCPDDIRAAGWFIVQHADILMTAGPNASLWGFCNNRTGKYVTNVVRGSKEYDKTDAEALNHIREQVGLPVIPVPDTLESGTTEVD